MICDKHLLNVHWQQHDWIRRVSATESHTDREVDMWGRPFAAGQVSCHITYVCRSCGTERDGGDCGCDQNKGDACVPRLAFLDARPEPSAPRKTEPLTR
jgi:hypothetical protein